MVLRTGYPLYLQVKAILLENINSGVFQPGTMIPTEQELMATHGVSRTTVRQAIQDLVVAGKLIRQAGRGTFVAKQEHIITSSPLYGFAEELEQSGRVIKLEHSISTIQADFRIATHLQVALDSNVILIARTAKADLQPIFYDESYLPESLAGLFKVTEDKPPYIYSILEAHGIVIASGAQSISAEIANEHYAALLRCAPLSPLLVIERTTQDVTGKPVEYSIARYRSDLYQYKVRLQRTAP